MEFSVKLLVFLSCLGPSTQLCEIPPANSNLVGRATQQLLRWMDWRSPSELNPSIYVGLRLSNQPSVDQDELYLNSLMIHYQQSFSSHPPEEQPKPSMGQLALYLLAVRGGCKDIGTRKGNTLVTQLKRYLEEEKHQIGHKHDGHPLTSYYQYGLAILALCVHDKKVPGHIVEKLLYAAENDRFLHGSQFSVDTAAVASLAFTCLQASGHNAGLGSRISRASKHIRDKILEKETPEGHFGNLYSSPLALQALMEAPSPESELACRRVGGALLKGLQAGAFQNPIPLSQLLPVLHQRTYLSLMQLDCNDERGVLEAEPTVPLTPEPRNIEVWLRVQTEPLLIRHDRQYFVPEGATLEDVLKKAQAEGWITYQTETTLSGPFLTSVMGIRPGERQYWQLLRVPDTPLQQGVLLQEEKLDSVTLLYLTSLPGFCLLLGAALVLEGGHAGLDPTDHSLWLLILLSCLLSVLYNLASFSLLTLTSALTVHMLGNFHMVGNLALSWLLFGSHLSGLSYVGISLTLVGMFLYHNCHLVASWWTLWTGRPIRAP